MEHLVVPDRLQGRVASGLRDRAPTSLPDTTARAAPRLQRRASRGELLLDLQRTAGNAGVGRLLALQRSAGNRVVGALLRKEAVVVKDLAKKVGIDAGDEAQIDEVDPFLESRRSLYQVALVGLQVHVTLPRSHAWTARYTNRALTEAAMGAAINMIYMGGASAATTRKVYEKVVGNGVKLTPATKQKHGEGAKHMLVIDERAMTKIAEALNLTQRDMGERWRVKYGEAKMIEFGLGSAHRNLDRLLPLISEQDLAARKMSVPLIRHLFDKHFESMIEVAKRHGAAASWREAFKRNLALHGQSASRCSRTSTPCR